MNVEMFFGDNDVSILCDYKTVLPELSFALEAAANWFFGRGVTHIKATRTKWSEGLSCTVEAKMPSRPMLFSQITPLSELVKAGYWPKELRQEELFQVPGDKHEIRQGHQRFFQANKEYTVMRSFGLNPSVSCGEIAYGIADLFTGFFWLGAKSVQHQLSLGTIQTQFDKGFDRGELEKYIRDPGPGYELTATVSSLSD